MARRQHQQKTFSEAFSEGSNRFPSMRALRASHAKGTEPGFIPRRGAQRAGGRSWSPQGQNPTAQPGVPQGESSPWPEETPAGSSVPWEWPRGAGSSPTPRAKAGRAGPGASLNHEAAACPRESLRSTTETLLRSAQSLLVSPGSAPGRGRCQPQPLTARKRNRGGAGEKELSDGADAA